MDSPQGARTRPGVFITFEGVEGSGKSVQIRKSEEYLNQTGIPCLVTRQPGGTEFGVSLRRVLLSRDGVRREPMSELLLYLADRYQHLKEVIEPALQRGITVLSDRYHDATRAYQGAARGVPSDIIDSLATTLGIWEPDGTILLDLDPEIGLARARQRNVSKGSMDAEGRFEDEALSFHRAVRQAYLELARRWPGRICVVSGEGTEEVVFSKIRPLLEKWVIGDPVGG